MQEGQEILTSRRPFINRNYQAITGLGGVILLIIGVTIALVSDSQKTYIDTLVNLFSKLGMYLILFSVLTFIMSNVIEPLANKSNKLYKVPFHYEVIYFTDRLMFKRYTENGASESHQIFYSRIKSLNQEKGNVNIKLDFGILDDELLHWEFDGHQKVDVWEKGKTTSEIESQKFRTSKKLSKSDRVRILDFLKMHIERSKAS
jgi:hypothetical protein